MKWEKDDGLKAQEYSERMSVEKKGVGEQGVLKRAERGKEGVRHVTGNDQDYLRKIPRVVVQKSALL